MGHGIAYVALLSGHTVALGDPDRDALLAAHARIEAAFDRAIERGKATDADRRSALERLATYPTVEPAAEGADILIEAVPARIDLKRALLSTAQHRARPHATAATGAPSLSVSAVAPARAQPGRVIGMHSFNPLPAMRLVELLRGRATSDATVADARPLAESLGKTAIVVNDTPG